MPGHKSEWIGQGDSPQAISACERFPFPTGGTATPPAGAELIPSVLCTFQCPSTKKKLFLASLAWTRLCLEELLSGGTTTVSEHWPHVP